MHGACQYAGMLSFILVDFAYFPMKFFLLALLLIPSIALADHAAKVSTLYLVEWTPPDTYQEKIEANAQAEEQAQAKADEQTNPNAEEAKDKAAVPLNADAHTSPAVVDVGANTELQSGLDFYLNGNYLSALKALTPLADQGVAAAQLRLGVMNEFGQGVPQNYRKAVAWYRKAAEQENAVAQYRLGEKYDLGLGIPQNKKIAYDWYSKSAAQGYAEALTKVNAEEDARAAKQAKAEAKAQAKADSEAKAAEQARLKAEAKAKAEEDTRAARQAKAEARAQAKAEAAAKAAEQARLLAEAKAKADEDARAAKQAKAETRAQAKAEAAAKAAEHARLKAEAKAKAEEVARAARQAKAESQAQAQAQAEAQAKAAEKTRLLAEAKVKTEEDARAARQAKAEARAQAKADADANVAEQARLKAEAKTKAEEDAHAARQAKAEARAQAKADADAKAAEQAKLKAEAKAKTEEVTRAAKASGNLGAGGGTVGAPPASDADFLAARDAFRVGDAARLDRIATRFKNSPLEPYIAYYQLRMRLDTADAATIRAFLARPDETPMIDRMRTEWLKLLGKKQQWDDFDAEYPHLLNDDMELACYALQARRRYQEDMVLHEARNLWMSSGKEFPDSCNPVFNAALAARIIKEADVWLRVRLALEAGNVSLARQLSAKLPAQRAFPSGALSRVATNPEQYLNKTKLENASQAQRMVALFALQRLAKQLPQLAYARWGKIAPYFNADEQHYFYAWLGYEAARSLDARALEWFRAAGDAPLTEQQLAWRTRAALRAQDWQEVLASVGRMPPHQQSEGAWRYWRARALKAMGQTGEAEKIFFALGSEYNYYGQLASEEISVASAPSILAYGYQPSSDELSAMYAHPAIQRTLALYRMDLRTDASNEWAWAVRNFDDKQLLVASEIARRNEMYDRAINAANRTVQLHDFSLRYLAPYRDSLRGHINQYGLEEAWVYGLMRQESRFVAMAKSNVGASGLMQIMPATARWVAHKMGMKNYRKPLVRQLETNLSLGTYYMKTVLAWFDNNPVLAAAAYNAGPSRARQWRGDTSLEGAIYAETIPFDETRDYVKKVMSNTVYYAQLFGQPQRSLKQRMSVIEGKNPANQKPIPGEK